MQIGWQLPHIGARTETSAIEAVADCAEELEYDSVWAADHIVMPTVLTARYPYNQTGAFVAHPLGTGDATAAGAGTAALRICADELEGNRVRRPGSGRETGDECNAERPSSRRRRSDVGRFLSLRAGCVLASERRRLL